MLKEERLDFTLETCDKLSKGLSLLSSSHFDAILLDLGLPDSQGLETFFKISQAAKNTPIIILTGQAEDTLGLEAVKQGAQDYLVKAKITGALIFRAITYAVERRKFEETRQKQEQIRRQNIILGSIQKIFEEALSSRSEEALGELCLSVAEEITQSKFGFVGDLNKEGLQDIAINNPGWDECKLTLSDGHRKPPGNFKIHGLYGKVLSEGKSFYTNNPQTHPERIGLPNGHPPLTSFLGAPLIDEGKVKGIIAVANREGGYSNAEVEALETLSSAITVAFSRKRAEAKLQEYNKDLERLVEERTKQLRQSERLAAIGQTAGMVGHDIRNPLQAILGDLYLLQSDIDSLPPASDVKSSAYESIQAINENIAYINKIVADLQDFARQTKPTFAEIELDEAIRITLSTIKVPDNIVASVSVQPKTKVYTDLSYIRRIITNLTTNAIQAMPNGGKLAIEAKEKGKFIKLIVADTGEGIPPEVQERIFTPLFTTKSKGQGFGLAVVKKFVEELGGTIGFESEVSNGTKFIVTLRRGR